MAFVDAPSDVNARALPLPKAEESKELKENVVVSPALIPVCTFRVGVLPLSKDIPLKVALLATELSCVI
jgi:hypothetical protein